MATLGVNIDHVATIRQARRTVEPDPVWAAALAELGGADAITVHLREDRRHIHDDDITRLAATVTSLLALAVISNLTAVFCGMLLGTTVLGIPYDLYVSNTISQLKMSDFLTGLMKAGVFGLLLGLIACYNGLRVTGGAAGVGRATTETVVQTVIFVILSDLFFSTIFYAIGWT